MGEDRSEQVAGTTNPVRVSSTMEDELSDLPLAASAVSRQVQTRRVCDDGARPLGCGGIREGTGPERIEEVETRGERIRSGAKEGSSRDRPQTSQPVLLRPQRQDGDPPGAASTNPTERPVAVVVLQGRISPPADSSKGPGVLPFPRPRPALGVHNRSVRLESGTFAVHQADTSGNATSPLSRLQGAWVPGRFYPTSSVPIGTTNDQAGLQKSEKVRTRPHREAGYMGTSNKGGMGRSSGAREPGSYNRHASRNFTSSPGEGEPDRKLR